MTTIADAAAPKLDLWGTIKQSYVIWFQHRGELIRISGLWLLVAAPLAAMIGWYKIPTLIGAVQDIKNHQPAHFGAGPILTEILLWPMVASVAVGWHRLILTHERIETRWYFRFDKTVVRYALALLLLFLLYHAPGYLGRLFQRVTDYRDSAQVSTVVSLVTAVASWISPRLSMVLPAIALDLREVSLVKVWNGTKGNTWRLFWGYWCCVLTVVCLQGGITFFTPEHSLVVLTGVWTAVTLGLALAMMIPVGFLSLSFRDLSLVD
jgi:hypothetical protein